MDKKLIWVWLSLHFGAGSDIYSKLIEYFGCEQDIYDSDDSDMAIIDWLTESQKRKLLDKNLEHTEEITEWCLENDVEIIAYSDPSYPSSLKRLRDFPAVLYCKGDFPNFDEEPSISVVGTRSMTTYGQKMAYEFGYTLARGGAITVSGMARGIDGTVAVGTLNALKTTVAVLGSGIDVIYPREHRALMGRIIDYGAVITEFPPHTPPNSRNFPIRNRIITGISDATVIVEADENSGAMISARLAIKQEKILFALPGPTKMHTSKGTNLLLKEEKALVARHALDILENLVEQYPDKIDLAKAKQRPKFSKSMLKPIDEDDKSDLQRKAKEAKRATIKAVKRFEEILPSEANDEQLDFSELTEIQAVICKSMSLNKTYSVDELVDLTTFTASVIMTELSLLEIEGIVQQMPGSVYLRTK